MLLSFFHLCDIFMHFFCSCALLFASRLAEFAIILSYLVSSSALLLVYARLGTQPLTTSLVTADGLVLLDPLNGPACSFG